MPEESKISMNLPKPIVCLVDCEDAHRESLKMAFTKRGFQITSFIDGAKFFSFLEGDGAKLKPALILLDLYAHGLGGFDAARRLVNRPAIEEVPIFMMSKHCCADDKLEAQGAGAITCLQKPVTLEQIEAEIEELKRRKAKNKAILNENL